MEYNKQKVNQMYLYFVNIDELLPVNERDFDIELIDDIAKNIVNDHIYQKTDDINECKYCPMKYYCDRYWLNSTM